MANLGILSLFGIVLNAAIVYIEFAEILIKEKLESGEGLAQPGEKSCSGLSRETFRQCLARAGKMRILPISLTTLTTVGGLIPLALFGGPLFEAMAVVIIFGLLLATLLTLLVLPAIYAIFVEDLRVKVAGEPLADERASVASVSVAD
jgi:multidrug efflux pump subunit AcrB